MEKPKVVVMVIFGFVGLWALTLHMEDLKKIQDLQTKLRDDRMPVFLLLNTCAMFSGVIGFGKPYCATAVSSLGLAVIAFGEQKFSGLVGWIEKVFFILSSISIVLEYLFIGIRYWLKSKQKDKLSFLFYWFLFFSVIFSIWFYVHLHSN